MAEIVHPPFPGATVHNQYLTLTGNTFGASTWSGTNLVMAGGDNVVLWMTGDTLGIFAAPNPANAWSDLGVYVASVSPASPIQYSQWTAGSTGYWAWISIPP